MTGTDPFAHLLANLGTPRAAVGAPLPVRVRARTNQTPGQQPVIPEFPMTVTDETLFDGIEGLLAVTMVWTIRNIKDAWDIENVPEEKFWYDRVVEGLYEAGCLYDTPLLTGPRPPHCFGADSKPLKATFFLDPNCTIPASRAIHAYIVKKWFIFRSMANRRANPLDYIMDIKDGNVLFAMPFSRYCKVGQHYIKQKGETQSILGMEVGNIGNYASIFGIKTAMVATKGPKKRGTLVYLDLRDIHKTVNSVLNGARENEGTMPQWAMPDGTINPRYQSQDGQEDYNHDVLIWLDLLAQVRLFLEIHRLSKWFLLDRENRAFDNGLRGLNNVRLGPALANYRRWIANDPRYPAVVFALPRQVIGRYFENHHHVMNLEEFELCRAIVAGMFDVESPHGPFPTHNRDYTQIDANDLMAYLGGGFRGLTPFPATDRYLNIGDLLLNALWHAAEQDQLHTLANLYSAATLTREHVDRALYTDGMFRYNYQLTGPLGTEFGRTVGQEDTEWLAFWRQWIQNPGREDLAREWYRRADYLVWSRIAECCNLFPGAWWSVKWGDGVDAVKKGFARYGIPQEQMWLIDRLGSVCLLINVFDGLVRGVTEGHEFLSQDKHFGQKEIKEMVVEQLMRRGTILSLVKGKHVSLAGILPMVRKTSGADISLDGPGMTTLQHSLQNTDLLIKFDAYRPWSFGKHDQLPWGLTWLSDGWHGLKDYVEKGANARRSNALSFDMDPKTGISWDMVGALAGWLMYYLHDVFNWDIPFKDYYEEIQDTTLGIYPQDMSFEEYFAKQYPEKLLREMHGGELPTLYQRDNWDKIPLNIWEWLFIPMMVGVRPVLAPQCSDIKSYS